MRGLFVVVHRWAGLFIAVFLFIAGLTGAVISWAQELDEWLNPDLFVAHRQGAPMPPLILASRFEAINPKARVDFVQLSIEPGKTLLLYVEPRIDPTTGKPYKLDYNQAYVEPATGEVRGKRLWGRVSLRRWDLVPFLYKLHYTMHLADFFGIAGLGTWLMGIVGIVWTFDCFVGLGLTLPVTRRTGLPDETERNKPPKSWLSRWAPAWKIKTSASAYRLNFDIHRAAGLWAWLFLLIIAFTSISMNLGDQVVRPLLSKVFTLTPDVGDAPAAHAPTNPPMPFTSIVKIASDQAARRQWVEPAGSIYFNRLNGIYTVSFFQPGAESVNGLQPKSLFVDGYSGAILGQSVPWKGTFADVFMQLQFPLHSGRIAGLPGRILLSVIGVIVAILSLTGIVIWFKKRLARLRRARELEPIGGSNPFLVAGSFLHELADEDLLRLRVSGLGRAAQQISDAGRSPSPGAAALLIVPTAVITLSAGSIAGKRACLRLWRLLSGISSAVWEFLGIFSSKGFWEAACWDARAYARALQSLGGRARPRR